MHTNSLVVFRMFLTKNEDGTLDASQITSRECYLAWLSYQDKLECEKQARKFQRALSNHLCGVDGRTPFDRLEEDAILLVLKRKLRWPCFPDLNIGRNGFRSQGFHEKHRNSPNTPVSTTGGGGAKRARKIVEEEEEEGDHGRMNQFENGIRHLIASFPTFNLDAWSAMMSFARFTVFAKIPISKYDAYPSAYPQELCDKVTKEEAPPGSFVAVSDIAAKECGNIVLAQNSVSLESWGVMTGGLAKIVPFPVADLIRVTMAVGKAFNAPGVKQHIPSLRINCLNRPQLPYDTFIYVDPASYLVVVHGTLVE
ncbi:hypothetical protein BASA81_010741 [Batrachochytrium salamandrivorans]|nr:hypothetical protein BASA81_010741 [Batrachochytrium salamandrivorans]